MTISLPVPGGLTDGWYRLEIQEGSFATISGEGNERANLEFEVDDGFELDATLPCDPVASDSSALVFPVVLDAEPGFYSLCYCDAQADALLESFDDGAITYAYAEGLRAPALDQPGQHRDGYLGEMVKGVVIFCCLFCMRSRG